MSSRLLTTCQRRASVLISSTGTTFRHSAPCTFVPVTSPVNVNIQTRHFSDPDGPKVKQLKVKKKVKKKKKKDDGERDSVTELFMRAYDAKPKPIPPASDEEMARRFEIGRNYNIGTWKEHNELSHDLACKLRMKHHAIKMLPKDTMWEEEALKEDEDGPPLWRPIPLDTPPIPGFDPSIFMMQQQQE